ncbi:unnamed protein product [Camellia sinensis]
MVAHDHNCVVLESSLSILDLLSLLFSPITKSPLKIGRADGDDNGEGDNSWGLKRKKMMVMMMMKKESGYWPKSSFWPEQCCLSLRFWPFWSFS